jgi:hypothetical protein
MMKRWFLFSLLLASGCLPQPSSEMQKARPELLIQGRVLHSNEAFSGPTAIYVERSANPETFSAEDGSFSFSFDADRLELLRLKYGLNNQFLQLYFVSANGYPESAVKGMIDIKARGEMNLGEVQLGLESPIIGRVVAYGAGVADARVLIGRQELITAADGTFTAMIPEQSSTPLVIEKSGFVQTNGNWLPGESTRDIELYSKLSPVGSINVTPILRTRSNQMVPLSYSANRAAHWIRFAGSPEYLVKSFEADAPWVDLRQPLQISNLPVVYYQFADRDLKILGPVQSYTLTTLEE